MNEKPKVILVVEGGVVQNVIVNTPIEVMLVDHDDLATGGDIPSPGFPTELMDQHEFDDLWSDPEQVVR